MNFMCTGFGSGGHEQVQCESSRPEPSGRRGGKRALAVTCPKCGRQLLVGHRISTALEAAGFAEVDISVMSLR